MSDGKIGFLESESDPITFLSVEKMEKSYPRDLPKRFDSKLELPLLKASFRMS